MFGKIRYSRFQSFIFNLNLFEGKAVPSQIISWCKDRQNTSVANMTVTQILADFFNFDIDVFCSFLVSPNALDETTEVISHVRVAKLGHMYAEEKETVIGFMLLTASLTSAIRLVRWALDQQMQTLHKCQDLQSRLHMLPFHEESLHFQRPHFNLVSLPLLLFDLV